LKAACLWIYVVDSAGPQRPDLRVVFQQLLSSIEVVLLDSPLRPLYVLTQRDGAAGRVCGWLIMAPALC
jgi:hypothetical protein